MEQVKRLDVPYQRQENPYFCGPACLSIVAKFYGLDHSQKEFASLIDHIEMFGTPCASMAALGRAVGLWAFESWHATPEMLRRMIDAGVPPIIYVQEKEALDQGYGELDFLHFYTVTGYTDDAFSIHDTDPALDGGLTHGVLPAAELMERWRAEPGISGRWMLALSPRPLGDEWLAPRFTGKPHSVRTDTTEPPLL